MNIYGLQKTTLLDYPGKVASTIFTGGCNFRCPFCHNMNIVNDLTNNEPIDTDEIIKHLKSRSGIIDGVCITGGEPTLQPDLIDFIDKIKNMGYLIKLDTNGSKTSVIKDLVENNLVDYIAIDVKSSFDKYSEICGLDQLSLSPLQVSDIILNIRESISYLINQSKIEYEFRTTVMKEYHNRDTFIEIAKNIKGAKNYYLQSFRDAEHVLNHGLSAYNKGDLLEFIQVISPYVEHVSIRGTD